ncbi:MAG: acyl-CoA dehydratase activase, partial [Synergistaceae bacterium]|nr:acyl-CoA dehydratase activase [Synergistaceae bacterium]
MPLLHVGLDVGSTTAKVVVLNGDDQIIHSHYCRHFADIQSTVRDLMSEIRDNCQDSMITMAVAGSGALGLAEGIQAPFFQELIACSASIGRYLPNVDVCIELGGEDAKLTFFDPTGIDQRMNETCAGGTGAFLDQMAALLGTDAAGLNELAKSHSAIYPIASRCGVFAKTDIQPLLNDGAARSDIAASIFQAIVNQTISGLACGRRIAGNVAFLGGPLYFLPELRSRFAKTLGLSPEQCIFPENPHLFVAIGAAILGKKNGAVDMLELHEKAVRFFSSGRQESINVLPALFGDDGEREAFKRRRSPSGVRRVDIGDYEGDAFLGIDVGSTTIKTALVGQNGELLFSRYCAAGGGEPLQTVRETLLDLYSVMPEGVRICRSGVTGYGEKLVQAALGVDIGEVETVAHARAAEFVLPGVDFVIDIGGQDMKCLGIQNGVVRRVFLNEACSSGCGSFLQSFAESLGMSVEEFALAAEKSTMPVDLGSRCTVFMTSRVRQAQKEGASVRDISAGLAYSVVRNALYKVLKLRDANEMGNRIVVQGGAFKNDALLRAFELATGREVARPEIPELMGAFGAALLARDAYSALGENEKTPGALLGKDELEELRTKTSTGRCGGCGNRCILTRTFFGGGRSYVSGSRCERGASDGKRTTAKDSPPNIFERKYNRLFGRYEPLSAEDAKRGVIGIPRVLNMYENYPLWFTLFTELGFRVELSGATPDENLGINTIPSQTVCYPAKLAHRHISDLLRRGVNRIFYPVILKERKEFTDAHQHFNCPVITGYPDVVYLNIEELRGNGVTFMRPPLPIDSKKSMLPALARLLAPFGAAKPEIKKALDLAYAEMESFRLDIANYGREAMTWIEENGAIGIVLAGHPYHLDPEVNHGIPELINSFGVAVLTEDSVCGLEEVGGAGPLYVVDQWSYHSRIYRAAAVVAKHPEFRNVQMVQLNSFGCGLDAISSDQAAALLEGCGKPHTLIKIDEGKNNGAVRIRIRSLLAAARMGKALEAKPIAPGRARAARKDAPNAGSQRTILCPPLS